MEMNLMEIPDQIDFLDMHYLYLESGGPFSESAPALWKNFHTNYFAYLKSNDENPISKVCSLYKTTPEYIYRAGVSLVNAPPEIPVGLSRYACFTLTGPYMHLPKACERVFELVEKLNLQKRDSFYVENYVNDPSITPENELQTQILIPIQ
eukprot:gene14286-19166_t